VASRCDRRSPAPRLQRSAAQIECRVGAAESAPPARLPQRRRPSLSLFASHHVLLLPVTRDRRYTHGSPADRRSVVVRRHSLLRIQPSLYKRFFY